MSHEDRPTSLVCLDCGIGEACYCASPRTRASADAPLDPQDLERLRTLAAGRTKAQLGEFVSGVGSKAMVAALAGLPVRAATRELIRQHLAAYPVACVCKPGWGHRSDLKREPADGDRVFDCPAPGPGGVP